MKFNETKFTDTWLIKPEVHRDERGFFLETFSARWFQEKGIDVRFIQDNQAKSKTKGVLRGLHFQRPPKAQTKLVRVTTGSVYDVIVDLRKNSSTYGQWEGFELSADNFLMLYVPKGFAHGYCTLEDNTEFCYKVDNYYAPNHDDGIVWDDSSLSINWPITEPILSEKDQRLQKFEEFVSPFV